jgi:hypothetical protein
MANQYTKAEEEGREKPKGANQFTTGKREKHDQATIDKIRAERAAQVAEEIMNDPESSRQDRLAAAKVLLPFGKSTLQSIESRTVNEWEEMSEDEMLEMVRALITSRPELIAALNLQPKPVQVDAVESKSAA